MKFNKVAFKNCFNRPLTEVRVLGIPRGFAGASAIPSLEGKRVITKPVQHHKVCSLFKTGALFQLTVIALSAPGLYV